MTLPENAMRWEDGRRSSNVEDRRGQSAKGKLALGGGATIIIAIIGLFLGIDTTSLLSSVAETPSGSPQTAEPRSPEEDRLADFVSVVLGSTEDTWNELYSSRGESYQAPTLVLFTEHVDTACGFQSAAVGPFYCPGDRQVYIDLAFFDQLGREYGAPGDFAQAYVVAHEVGHHLQTLDGTSRRVHEQGRGLSDEDRNELSVRQELQADCYAGVWGYHSQGMLEEGDLEEGLEAAHAVGDDTLSRRAGARVMPESFTHGTSEQRQEWFLRGFRSGDPSRCDTFSARTL